MSGLPRVTEAIAKRVRRSGYEQGRHGTCLICKGSWDDCPHNRSQVASVIEAVKMSELLGIELPR